MAKDIRNWIIIFVLTVVLTLLWHKGIFGAWYPAHLDAITVKDAAGNQVPRMLPFLLSHVLLAIGFVFYVPAVARTRAGFVWHGLVMGLVTLGTFTFLSGALDQNWTTWLMWMDCGYGVFMGVITGFVMSYLAPAGTGSRSAVRV